MNEAARIIHTINHRALLLVLISICLLNGCATINGPADQHDPFERYNRAMHQFNDSLDKAVIKPVAKAYVAVVPTPVDRGVSNSRNLKTTKTILLQITRALSCGMIYVDAIGVTTQALLTKNFSIINYRQAM